MTKQLKKGFCVFSLKTQHCKGNVIKVTSNLFGYIGANYYNTTKYKQKNDIKCHNFEGTTLLATNHPTPRKSWYEYCEDHIFAFNRQTGEACLPVLLLKHPHIVPKVQFYDKNGNQISKQEAEELGYKDNETFWIVPYLTSFTKINGQAV